jgi:SWIM zinc finger
MATTESSASFANAHPSTREERGLELYRRGGIERISRDAFIVPSRSRRRVEYLVDLDRQSCECRDHQRTGGPCKHVSAAMLYQAWIRRSARVVATSGAFAVGEE